MDPSSVWWANPKALAAFAAGKAAYFPMASPLSIPALDASAVKGKYKYALMPTLPPGETSNPSPLQVFASAVEGGAIPVYSQLMAASLVCAVPVVVLYFMFQKYLIGGLTAGSVKKDS
ncbi:hypothetical protein ACQCSV_14205 [Pseudarthrobacter sp. S3]|uniref:hypothetical protein n=1 Tax=Pseudarthrobacter sp. S3 TaxID=3418419 RepID=UPI003CE79FAA